MSIEFQATGPSEAFEHRAHDNGTSAKTWEMIQRMPIGCRSDACGVRKSHCGIGDQAGQYRVKSSNFRPKSVHLYKPRLVTNVRLVQWNKTVQAGSK